MNTHTKTYIQPINLIRLSNLFKEFPQRIFLRSDITHITGIRHYPLERYLFVLVKLGIIEVVPARYQIMCKHGRTKWKTTHNSRAYRLKSSDTKSVTP